ncbi:MAG: flagellar FliJ family protein [Bacillota bacterium]
MSQFKFSLEKLLNYKIAIENQKQESLASHQIKRQQLEWDLSCTLQEYDCIIRSITSVKTLDLPMLSHQLEYMESLKKKADQLSDAICETDKIIKKCRHELIIAMKNRKVIEKLKVRKKQAFFVEMDKRQTNEINESALIRHLRGSES